MWRSSGIYRTVDKRPSLRRGCRQINFWQLRSRASFICGRSRKRLARPPQKGRLNKKCAVCECPLSFDHGRTFLKRVDVRFGSKADIDDCLGHVRFTPKSGHWNSAAQCTLCAKSGHSTLLFDHLVSTRKERWRYGETKRLGGFQVNHQFELG